MAGDSQQVSAAGWLRSFRRTSRARHTIAFGALLAVGGIGLAGSTARGAGGVLLVAGWLVLAAGVHSFGRRGAA